MNRLHERQRAPLADGIRRALSLVELLIVLAIVAILLALLLPAIMAARESARRTACAHHLRQIGLGMLAYESSVGAFPPGGIEWRGGGDTSQRQLGWPVFLLPQLEQQAVYDQLDLSKAFDSPTNARAAATTIGLFICPAADRSELAPSPRAPLDYGGISGERITGPNQPPKGPLVYDQAFAETEIMDGLSHTLFMAEAPAWPDGEWINGRSLMDQAFPIHQAPPFENDIRGGHGKGALTLLGDATVHWLREDIDLDVLAALCTRAGAEVISHAEVQ